jgi:RimJ/RimL family protein N-acetyltransferase
MDKSLLRIPTHFETERLHLRPYHRGDAHWYYTMSQRNRAHLVRYEAGNPLLALRSEADAEALMRQFAAEWAARTSFFLGAFDKRIDAFVAQIYVGPTNWDVPEFQIGYFADKDHEGHGYITEAAQATLEFVFEHLRAERVCLECDDTNTRSARVAERCGMVREGHFRQNKRSPEGVPSGTLHFGLLRREFEALAVPLPPSIVGHR